MNIQRAERGPEILTDGTLAPRQSHGYRTIVIAAIVIVAVALIINTVREAWGVYQPIVRGSEDLAIAALEFNCVLRIIEFYFA